jgi:tetratricopeptide (TPR) repeat protein
MQPVRHTLGAVLLAAGHAREAEEVYREDLRRWPENGWALYGLSQAMKKQKSDEYTTLDARFKKAWAKADTKIGSSCLCVQGAE